MKSQSPFNICRIAVLLILSLFSINGNTQQHHFDRYSVKQGLAQSDVYSIVQNHQGVLWMGTKAGVSMFNGKTFRNYSVDDGLAEGTVRKVYIDKNGKIWLGHNNGGITRIYKGNIEKLTILNADVTTFCEDKNGNLWVGSQGDGVVKILNPNEKTEALSYEQYKGQEGVSDVVNQIICLSDGSMYFSTNVGVKYFQQEIDKIKFFKKIPAYFQIICMYESRSGDLWFGSYNGGLYRYNTEADNLVTYDIEDGLASNWVSSITEDEHGNTWVGTWGGGITQIDQSGGLTIINRKNGLLADKIRCLLVDREDNLLIGTSENGLLVYKGDQFVHYDINDGLVDDQVTAILASKSNELWVGTNKGISVHRDNHLIEKYDHTSGLFYEEIRFIKEDPKGNVWLGTANGGVVKFNAAVKKFEVNHAINSWMQQPLITALDIDASGNIWVGTTDGLINYEIATNRAERITSYNGLSGNKISVVYTDSKGVVWVGAINSGLTSIKNNEVSISSFPVKSTPTAVVEDKKGRLWVGTESKGVLVFDGDKVLQKYDVNSGLLSNYVALINLDDNGNVWIGTNKGLNQYDVEQERFYAFTDKEGYAGVESKNNATSKDARGNLWFGTVQGAVKLNVLRLKKNELAPLTSITGWNVNFKERALESEGDLNYQEKSITFNYHGVCLTNPDKVLYKVMLEGIDNDWRPVTRQTYATYNPVPPGKYTFKVKASNNNGVWNTEAVTYKVVIHPPFWQTIPFYIALIILAVLAFIGFVKFRERKLMREKKVLEDNVQARTEELVQKNMEIERKNEDIIASITYAKRIQDAILPTDEMVASHIEDAFILFEPKDIVSGDFYWLTSKSDTLFFAAVDCTGHGVPGAFMSIIGHDLLDQIVGEYHITCPSKILDELNKGVTNRLKQEEGADVQDGMDIALCSFDPATNVLEYAGAYNPLYILSKHELKNVEGESIAPNMEKNGMKLYEIKSNRFPIGSYTTSVKQYTPHSFKLNKGDLVYVFSDGYADQFGGPSGKKFRYKQFKQLFLEIHEKDMDQQKQHLKATMDSWRGNLEQIDDILVFGVRL